MARRLNLESSSIVQFYRNVSLHAATEVEPDAAGNPDEWRKWAFRRLAGNAAKNAAKPGRWRPAEIDDRVQIAVTALHRVLRRNVDPTRGVASAWKYAAMAVEHALVVEGEKGMFGTARNKRVKFRALVLGGMSEKEAGEASELAGIMRTNKLADVAGYTSDDGGEIPIDEALSAVSANLAKAGEVEDSVLLSYETGIIRELLFDIVEDEAINPLIRDIARVVYIEGAVDSARAFVEHSKRPTDQQALDFGFLDTKAGKAIARVNEEQYARAHNSLIQIMSARLAARRRIA